MKEMGTSYDPPIKVSAETSSIVGESPEPIMVNNMAM